MALEAALEAAAPFIAAQALSEAADYLEIRMDQSDPESYAEQQYQAGYADAVARLIFQAEGKARNRAKILNPLQERNVNITEFLEARIAEDEAAARAASPGPWRTNAEATEVFALDDITVAEGFALSGAQLRATTKHIARHDPARMLAECAAKRAIIKDWEDPNGDGVWEGYDYGCALTTDRAARALAAIYSDHPDYQQEWAL
jgi:hypothetical protein